MSVVITPNLVQEPGEFIWALFAKNLKVVSGLEMTVMNLNIHFLPNPT